MKFRLLLPLLLLLIPTAAPPALPACTQAQHDAYKTRGPDGLLYPTWHPQVDTKQGCVFDHEHGSDPAAYDPVERPLFGYTATSMGVSEGNAGFKVYAFIFAGYRWMITQHQGTGNAVGAACTEFHTLDIAVRTLDGTLVASIHTMPSFGGARINRSNAAIPRCTPVYSTGVRLLPSMDADNLGYEPWRVGRENTPFLRYGDLTFTALNAQTACDTYTCTATIQRGTNGAERSIKFENNNQFWLRSTDTYSGTFTYSGTQQYIAPGTDIHIAAVECWAWNSMAYIYQCGGVVPSVHDSAPFTRNTFITGSN